MTIFQAIILGIIQGLAEFLPISSSGHLSLFQKIFKLEEGTMTFGIILHVATLIPVLIVFRKDIIALIKRPFQKVTYLLIIGTIPAALIALFLGDYIKKIFESGSFLALGFFITGIFLLYADSMEDGSKKLKEITYLDSIIIGLMQAIGTVSGISRSGSTLTGALTCKISRKSAAKFSFLLSIPAILGSAVLEIKEIVTAEVPTEEIFLIPTIFGFIAALISGFFAINFMMKLIKECKLSYFSYYVFALSGLILIDQLFTRKFF